MSKSILFVRAPAFQVVFYSLCLYSEISRSVFSRILTEYREVRSISPDSGGMQENTDQKFSEYAHFSRTVCFSCFLNFCYIPFVFSN